ncbi:MAG TPA: leucine zipper domain-containing protein [Aldersonia sp.]
MWLDGVSWQVVSLHGRDVTLRAGTVVQRVAVAELALRARPMGHQVVDRDPAAVVLSSLSKGQREVLEGRAAHVRSVLAATADGATLQSALQTKAQELDVSVRTLERWTAAYRTGGITGLADAQIRNRYGRSVDSRWDATCLSVLDRYVDGRPRRWAR